MKTAIQVFIVLIATWAFSCKKDTTENYDSAHSEDSNIVESGDTTFDRSDTSTTTITDNNTGSATNGTSTRANVRQTTVESEGMTNSTSVNKSGNIQRDQARSGKNLKGYSAPNGTNAENNDGDIYTKNDTTRMPSGPPIK